MNFKKLCSQTSNVITCSSCDNAIECRNDVFSMAAISCNVFFVSLTTGSWFACVHRVMDAGRRLLCKHERSGRVA